MTQLSSRLMNFGMHTLMILLFSSLSLFAQEQAHNHSHDTEVHEHKHEHHHPDSLWAQIADEIREARARERQHWDQLSALIEEARRLGVTEPEMERIFEFDGRDVLRLPRSMMGQIIMASMEHALDQFEIEMLTNPQPIAGLTPMENKTAWGFFRQSFSAFRRLAISMTWESLLKPVFQGIRHPVQLSRYLGAQWSFLRGSYGIGPATLGATLAGGSYLLTEFGESFVNPIHGACHWNAYLSAALGFSVMSGFRSGGFLMSYDRGLGPIERVRLGYLMVKTHRLIQKMFSAILIKQTSDLGLPTLTKRLRKEVMTEGLEQMDHNGRTEMDAVIRNSVLWADFATKAQTLTQGNDKNPLRLFEDDARLLVDPNQTLIMKMTKLAEMSANFEALSAMIREELTKSHVVGDPKMRERLRFLGDLERSFARFRFFVQASIITGKSTAFAPAWLEAMFDYELGLIVDLRRGQDLTLLKLKEKHWNDIVKASLRNGQMMELYPTSTVGEKRTETAVPTPTVPTVMAPLAVRCGGVHSLKVTPSAAHKHAHIHHHH